MSDNVDVIDSLCIRSELTELPKVETLIERVCEKLSINDDYFGNILIAVTEGVTNAVVHGNGSNKDKEVKIVVRSSVSSILFTISDEGRGFDFDNLPDPTSPDNLLLENGRGVFLMKNLADEVGFSNGGASVTVVFSK
jgi:serine/threonine-protein kinase RsbW